MACQSFDIEAIAQEPLGIDDFEAKLLTQLLAQLAHMAFDNVLLNVFITQAIDRVEKLTFGSAATSDRMEVFQYPAFSP